MEKSCITGALGTVYQYPRGNKPMPHVARATILVPRQRPDNYQVPTLQPQTANVSQRIAETEDS